jgi:hypothetical protein
VPAEAGDRLVEHEHRALAAAAVAQPLEEPGRGLLHRRRLEDDGRDLRGWRRNRASTLSRSLYWKAERQRRTLRGIPAGIAVEPMNQSSTEKERLVAADRDEVASGGRAGELDRRRS